MKLSLFIRVLSIILVVSGCQEPLEEKAAKVEYFYEDETPAAEEITREYVLPAKIAPVSDTKPNFGIDLKPLSAKEVTVVESAWLNYQLILAGKEPKCSATFGLSDGGSTMYDCGTYTIMRIKGLADKDGKYGYDYGPSLDFLNGHKIERLEFLSYEQLKDLERAPLTTQSR